MHVRQHTMWLVLLTLATGAFAGSSVVVNPELAYWKGRSAQSIAEEIQANGYSEARIVCGGDPAALSDLTKAFREAEIKTWLLVDLTAVPPSGLPEGWKAWKMKLRSPPKEGGVEHLCPNNAAYVEWKRKQIVSVLSKQPFLGIDLAGASFPSENGPDSDDYGCFCDSCLAAFAKMYPDLSGPPDFGDASSPRYWKTDTTLYEKWVGLRVASIAAALDALVAGEEGIRKKCPGVKVSVWCSGVGSVEAMKRLRENTAADAGTLANRVKPDMVVIRTDRSDWAKPDLPASYCANYKHIVDSIHEVSADLPVLLQTDIGSTRESRRTRLWTDDLAKCAKETGFSDVVFHEYSLGDYIYTEPPALVKAALDEGKVRLVFNKRMDSTSASNIGNYSLTSGQVDYAATDGCTVVLSVSGGSAAATVRVSGLSDDEAARLFHDKPARTMERSVSMAVEEAAGD